MSALLAAAGPQATPGAPVSQPTAPSNKSVHGPAPLRPATSSAIERSPHTARSAAATGSHAPPQRLHTTPSTHGGIHLRTIRRTRYGASSAAIHDLGPPAATASLAAPGRASDRRA